MENEGGGWRMRETGRVENEGGRGWRMREVGGGE